MISDPLKRVMKEVHPMSMYEDLGVVADILSYMKSKNILELGAGAGSWMVAMNYLTTNNTKFLGYEDFSTDYGFNWPTDENALKLRMINLSQGLGKDIDVEIKNENIYNIDMDYIKNLNIKFDVVRLDCMENNRFITDLFYKIYPYTTDNCIFLVDDITPNLCPNRFLSYMDRVSDGILKPIWFGNKEGAWCKRTFECGDLQQHILNSIHNILIGKSENIFWYNEEHRLITTGGLIQ